MTDEPPLPIRVLIADDHGVVRAGLRLFLAGQADIAVVGEAASGREALALIARLHPHVVLMDLLMPDLDGIEATRLAKQQAPEVEIVALTSFIEAGKVIEVIQAGAIGFLLKDARPAELMEAIHAARRGEARLHPEAMKRLMHSVAAPKEAASEPGLDQLTEREREVLTLIVRGQSNKEMARALVISETTVKHHMSSILGKLGLTSRTQAALYGLRKGLE